MHEYDVALKSILMRPGSALLTALTGADRLRWLNVENPAVRNLRVDMLGELPATRRRKGDLIQIEFQSQNDKAMQFRMAEYLGAIGRTHRRMPCQVVLYVGEPRMHMKDRIEGPDFSIRYTLVDIRDLDGGALLASPNLGDNVIALLTRLGSQPETVRKILDRIANGPAEHREQAMAEFLIVACLRKLDGAVKKEAKQMPILNDIMDSEVFGPLIRQGRAEGRVEGSRAILLALMEKRFGNVPPRFRKRLAALTPEELSVAGLRILDAERIDDLFVRQQVPTRN